MLKRFFSTRIAIIGTGPSGLYTAKYLLKKNPNINIDLFDKLPTPYGLIRYGVSPDHQNTKNVIIELDNIINNKNIRFFGNINISKEVSSNSINFDILKKYYNGIVLAYGAENDIKLNIKNENLEGIYPVQSLVRWYNGHPDYDNFKFNNNNKSAVIIGQGNVAIDAARILTSKTLDNTDISKNALKYLKNTNIKQVYLVGRRGPIQASFTTKELRELMNSNDIFCSIDPSELSSGKNKESLEEVANDRVLSRKFELIEKLSSVPKLSDKPEIAFRFLLNPIEFLPDKTNPTKVGAVVFERTKLIGNSNEQKAVPTGEKITIPTNLVFRSIGYTPALDSIDDLPIIKGKVTHHEGRVTNSTKPINGLYVTGWLKRGSTGIIGTNIPDAQETANSIVNDLESNTLNVPTETSDIIELLKSKNIKYVNLEGWNKIDKYELLEGHKVGKCREKLLTKEEMLKIANL